MPGNDFSPSVVGVALLSSSSVLGAIAIVTTCLRVTVRYTRRALGWDDALMVAAMVATIVRYSINIHAVRAGYGQHQDELTADEYVYTNFLSWLGQIFLFLSLCLLKISIGLLIMRIKDDRKSKIFQWTLIGGLILTNLEVLIVLLAECRPMKAYWEPGTGECWPNKFRIYSIYIQVGYGILTDLIYSLMPIAIVRKLNMSRRKKLSICALMWMGLVATVCAALRARSLGLKTSDLSWDYAIAAIWGNVELGLGIIASNLVLIRAYISFFRDRRSPRLQPHTFYQQSIEYTNSRAGYQKQPSLSVEISEPSFFFDRESQRTLTSTSLEAPAMIHGSSK